METDKEYIQRIVGQFGLEVVDEHIDLREQPNEKVMEFFRELEKSGKFVFHGTNAEEKFDKVEARQANDSAKESGNKKAVYAADKIITPLALALWNHLYLKSKFRSITTGWDNDESGKMIFKLSPNAFELLKSGDQNFYKDGFVYVLDKTEFINAEGAGSEWHSESDQQPVMSCRVSKKLADAIFITGQGEADNVIEYSLEEMERMDTFNEKAAAQHGQSNPHGIMCDD